MKTTVKPANHRNIQFKSSTLEAIHRAASGLKKVEAISLETMRDLDVACLNAVEKLLQYE